MGGTTVTQTRKQSTVTNKHIINNLPPKDKKKIVEQINLYMKIKDIKGLPKISCKTYNQSTKVQIQITYTQQKDQKALRHLITAKQFPHTQREIVRLFKQLCVTVSSLHKVKIPHCAIAFNHIYLHGDILIMGPPAFTLIEKAKREYNQSKPPLDLIACMTYEQFDIWSLGILLIGMLTKTVIEKQCTKEQLTQLIKGIKSLHLKSLAEGMIGIKARPTIHDVIQALSTQQINPQLVEQPAKGKDAEKLEEITLLSLFQCKNECLVPKTSSNQKEVIEKDCATLMANIVWLKTSSILYFQLSSKVPKKVIISFLLSNSNISGSVKAAFSNIEGLFSRLKKDSTSLFIDSAGHLIIIFRADEPIKPNPPKSQKDNTIILEPPVRMAALLAKEKNRQKQKEVQVLLTVCQRQTNKSIKYRLKSVQELIQKSRELLETSRLISSIQNLWRNLLFAVIKEQNPEELLLVMEICHKYWLQSDELRNIMQKRLGRLIGSGLWMLE